MNAKTKDKPKPDEKFRKSGSEFDDAMRKAFGAPRSRSSRKQFRRG